MSSILSTAQSCISQVHATNTQMILVHLLIAKIENILGPDNDIESLKQIFEYLTAKLDYREVKCLILKLLA